MRVGRLAAPAATYRLLPQLRLLLPAINYHCHREEPPLGGDVAISFHSLRIRLKTQENEALSADFN